MGVGYSDPEQVSVGGMLITYQDIPLRSRVKELTLRSSDPIYPS